MSIKVKYALLCSAVVLSAFGLSACAGMNDVGANKNAETPKKEAGPAPVESSEITDPFEGTNRAVFSFNTKVDDNIIHPVLKGYRAVVPKPARTGVHNFLQNLKTPTRFANQVLQGDMNGAGTELTRGVVNTFAGFGGLMDVASAGGLKHESEDFGQTLGVWGVGHGPYVVVPVLGPSSMRDYAGYAVDSFADPLRMYTHNVDREGLYYAKVGMDYLDLRESLMDVLKSLQASSIDYYAATRSTYVQRREALVKDQDADNSPLANFDEF